MKKRTDILGVEFDSVTKKETEAILTEAVEKKERMKIFTPNPEMLLTAHSDEGLRALLCSAELVLPDGIGVIIASRILGTPLPERVSGIDTAEFILSLANKKALRVFLLGARKGVAKKAAERIAERYPNAVVCGTHHGYFDKSGEENDIVVENIKNAAPDILLVCFGFPAQERWIAENLPNLPTVLLCAGFGGTLDVWSGELRRAPKIFQRLGIEWLWRVLKEPKRAKIFWDIPIFLAKILKTKRGSKPQRKQKDY